MKPSNVYNCLADMVTGMEEEGYAGSYIQSIVKAVRSWLDFNNIHLGRRKVTVTHPKATPTLKNEQAPEPSQLRKAFGHADTRTKTSMALIAFAGLRPESLGNYRGTDGLRVLDLPEIQIDNENKRVWFSKVPTKVVVRDVLSKAGHSYFTLLCEEGCRYVAEELERRLRAGEELTPESPIIINLGAEKPRHVTTKTISADIRYAFRKAGFNWRPYLLRVYFDTRLLIAESKTPGFLRDYRVFLMGHRGDIEHVYTLNKGILPISLEESILSSFIKASQFIETTPRPREEDKLNELRELFLFASGYTEEEIAKLKIEELTTEELKRILQKRLMQRASVQPSAASNGGQRIVDCQEAEKLVNSGGYSFEGSLPNGKVVIRPADLPRDHHPIQ